MEQGLCTHTWIGEFAARLIQLRPQTSIASAVASAVRCIHDARDIHPHRAVEIYLVIVGPLPRAAAAKKPRRALTFPAALFGRIRAAQPAHA